MNSTMTSSIKVVTVNKKNKIDNEVIEFPWKIVNHLENTFIEQSESYYIIFFLLKTNNIQLLAK